MDLVVLVVPYFPSKSWWVVMNVQDFSWLRQMAKTSLRGGRGGWGVCLNVVLYCCTDPITQPVIRVTNKNHLYRLCMVTRCFSDRWGVFFQWKWTVLSHKDMSSSAINRLFRRLSFLNVDYIEAPLRKTNWRRSPRVPRSQIWVCHTVWWGVYVS